MKKRNLEALVGASIFLALFILIAGIMWLKEVRVASKEVEYSVLFKEVGNLQVGDPVTVGGVKKGRVKNMDIQPPQVVVTIKLDKKIPLTDSCKIIIQNIGLMGERKVGIKLSPNGKPVKANTKDEITYITGYFDSGIAEAMGLLGRVLLDAQTLLIRVTYIINETVGDSNFIVLFHDIVNRIDTLALLVEDVVVESKPKLNTTLNNLKTVTSDIKNIVKRHEPQIATIVDNGEKLTQKAIVIADEIDSISGSVKSMLSDIEDGKGTIGMLAKDEAFKEELVETMNELDSLINKIDNDGLKLRIKLFGNKKYFKENK